MDFYLFQANLNLGSPSSLPSSFLLSSLPPTLPSFHTITSALNQERYNSSKSINLILHRSEPSEMSLATSDFVDEDCELQRVEPDLGLLLVPFCLGEDYKRHRY